MSANPTTQQLAELDDETLARLAREWRTEAARGEKRAFGMAHALEVERRRRLRDSELARLEPLEPPALPPPWWKFWASKG